MVLAKSVSFGFRRITVPCYRLVASTEIQSKTTTGKGDIRRLETLEISTSSRENVSGLKRGGSLLSDIRRRHAVK